jgi:uncharacterized protein YebE (UPF0316 family)
MEGTHWITVAGVTILIFLARISDVTLGTLRISFISRGEKYIAPFVAFCEMLIWLFAIRQIMQNLGNVTYYLAYSAGFASGVFVGLLIEEKLAIGTRLIRTITRMDAADLVAALREADFGVTSVVAEGNSGPVNLIYSVIKRSDLPKYIGMVNEYNPRAFYSIEDIRSVNEGIFPRRRNLFGRWFKQRSRMRVKSK